MASPARGPRSAPRSRHSGGERKLVTVLCCGLSPACGQPEQGDLDTLHQQLQALYDLAQREAGQYGGGVQPVVGDQVLVVFGLPVAQEDHAQRTVLAALGLQQRLRALEAARTEKQQGWQAYALRLLGESALHEAPPDVECAETSYRQTLTLAEDLGMHPLQAHCHLGLGTLYAKTGRPEPARAQLSTAIEMYHTMDMTFWLPQAEAAHPSRPCSLPHR